MSRARWSRETCERTSVVCTICIYFQVNPVWPVMIASNRDEYEGRPWRLPDHHWPDAPDVFGPLDVPSGGAWLAVNRRGVFCAVVNHTRAQSIGTDKRSRGELVLTALSAATLTGAVKRVTAVDRQAYLPFHLVIATRKAAALLSSDGTAISHRAIEPGVHIVSSRGLDDPRCYKATRLLDELRESVPHAPDADDWRGFRQLLARPARDHPKDGLWVNLGSGYGTRSSAIVCASDDAWHILHSTPQRTQPPMVFRAYALGIDLTAGLEMAK